MQSQIPIDFIPQRPKKRRSLPPKGTHLGFGRYFSDHMLHAAFSESRGWHSAVLEASGALGLVPQSHCLHYGQSIFEGLKAYRGPDGRIGIFRLAQSARRFANSARRLAMEPLPEDFYGRALAALTLADRRWIPDGEGEALYLRPVMVSTDPCVCVRPADEFLFYVVASPSGALFSESLEPVAILVEDEDVRAVRGGLGEAKTSANYAHSFRAHRRAEQLGYAQVLWLDAAEHRFAEEVGTMNIFFLFGDELATPDLDGTILPGITRDSVLTLARDWGMKVSERRISIDEIIDGALSGRLTEVFGTGTAAIVSPVGKLAYKGRDYAISGGRRGSLTLELYKRISAIQRGEAEDKFGWVTRIDHLDMDDLLRG